ncbi:Gibberellin 3-beta-dioxygenase 2-3 [Nymphaea thermarum]|nr:Gibberellin 3-beta-dioxygenase 2-3 [Nymphaea thermarum]
MAGKPVKRVEFRAPPPSPIAAFKIGLENEASLDEFLRRSVRVPELILPYHLFPREEFGGDPPEIDFAALAASEDRSVAELLSSAEAKGCFQLVNHGVPKKTVGAIREAITEFFNLPSEQKLVLSRNPASKSGYEEISCDGSPITEELLWCGDEKKIMSPAMSSVWPQGSHGYKNFRRQLKRLSKETEGIASKILQKRSKGQYKHVVGRGMLSISKDYDHSGDQVSVALFYSPSQRIPPPLSLDSHASDHHEQPCERSITIVQQIKIVLYLMLFYHLLIFIKQFT